MNDNLDPKNFTTSNTQPPHRCLQTDGKGPKKNAPCIFPFKYKKVVHYDCTNVADPDGKFWCSTKVDK